MRAPGGMYSSTEDTDGADAVACLLVGLADCGRLDGLDLGPRGNATRGRPWRRSIRRIPCGLITTANATVAFSVTMSRRLGERAPRGCGRCSRGVGRDGLIRVVVRAN